MMNEINLPFGETIKRSFSFVLNHFEGFVKISLLWGLIITAFDAIEGFPSLCPTGAENCASDNKFSLYILSMFLGGISVAVSYIKYVIERKEYTNFFNLQFGKRELRYIWALLKLIFACIMLSLIIGLVFGGVATIFGLGTLKQTSMLMGMIGFFFVGMFFSRYFLVFPAIAQDNFEITFKKSFRITKGNINSIFWGMVVMSLPITILNIIFASLYYAIGSESWIINCLFSFILVMTSLLNDALKASFFAHAYQYFLYFEQKAAQEVQA